MTHQDSHHATPDVSIVIVNWNTADLLRNCLASITRETHGLRYETWVVDNASHDGSPEMLARDFADVHLIANQQNRGFAAANNQALRRATGRFCLLLNPDTTILDHAIERSVSFAEQHPECAVVGCQVMEDGTTVQRTCFSFPSVSGLLFDAVGLCALFPRSRVFSRSTLGWWDRDTERDVDVVSGMFMLVRQAAIEQVGLMDEDYFVYAEEADWCWRFRRAGWKCTFTPEARIVHHDGGGKSTSQVSVKMFVQMQKSLLIFLRKNLGVRSWLLAKCVLMLGAGGRAAMWSMVRVLGGRANATHKASQAIAALRFHISGEMPS